jgi:2-polyprenyl-6-methoxyphenol hydroxylase-like FAD-dependent oxidoreductase
MADASPPARGHAVVAGGSLAGLLAARVLADHFEHVTLIERDVLPAPGVQRRGVPQGRHTHFLFASGREALEELLPGFTAGLVAQGAVLADLQGECRWYVDGHRMRQAMTGSQGLMAGRALLEGHVRERVRSLPNVEFREGAQVLGLMVDASEERVAGVRFAAAREQAPTEALEADLVVDATGRGGRAMAWLREAGFEEPAEDEVDIDIVYTTRHFRRRPGELGGDKAINITTTADNRRGGSMNAQEDDTWIVTLFGYLGERAPLDFEGFLSFAGTLESRDIHDVIREAQQLDDGVAIRFPASRRRRYERLERFPHGYLVLGDALLSFNPVYAQGMSVTALEARALAACLNEEPRPGAGRSEPAGRFLELISPLLDVAWATSTGGDLRYPEIQGTRTPEMEEAAVFMSEVYLAASRDVEVGRTVVRLVNLQDGPEALADPDFLKRVRAAVAPG